MLAFKPIPVGSSDFIKRISGKNVGPEIQNAYAEARNSHLWLRNPFILPNGSCKNIKKIPVKERREFYELYQKYLGTIWKQ